MQDEKETTPCKGADVADGEVMEADENSSGMEVS